MQDNVAIVTGASRGIGLAIATELASQGYSLGLVSRSKTDIENASKSIQKQFPQTNVIHSAFDVVNGVCVEEFVGRVFKELGDVSVLVNNAGDYRTGTSSMAIEETKRMMDVNFLATTSFVQSVLPSMKKSGRGYIFNIASMCGVQAFSDVGSYCASKFALVGYSSSLAQELAPMGIKVTAICPSWVNTKQAEGAPIKREEMIQPNDIALTIRYLLTLGKSASIREIEIHCK